MKLSNRIAAFTALGTLIRSFSDDEIAGLSRKASSKNNWVTEENLRMSLEGIAKFLEKDKLEKWLAPYSLPEENKNIKRTGVVMAGNIPLAGFHDFLSVLISGNEIHAKLNPQDPVLLPFIANELLQIEPEFKSYIHFEERLIGMDAMVVSLSDNSFRYYEQYFKHTPHIIRKIRQSCAVLNGTESSEELVKLGEDITFFYGLSTRSISKLFVPEGYNFTPLFETLAKFRHLADHHKFVNHYDYNKSIYLVNGNPHLDTGFMLFKEDKNIFSPVSVVFFEYYKDEELLRNRLKEQDENIECIAGHPPFGKFSFGEVLKPEVWDFPVKEDILTFLQKV